MNNLLTYKGYHTKVEYSIEDRVLHGKIEGLSDLVTFECETLDGVEDAFHEAVDDYLAFCDDIGRAPDKEYNGIFNVRLSPDLHKAAVMEAANSGITLNQYVVNAVTAMLKEN